MVEKEITMTSDEILEYIKENIKEFDLVNLAYNRVSAEGEVLGMDFSEYNGVPGFKLLISLNGDVINDAIEVDLIEFKEDIIELHHYPKDESKKSVYIEVL